MPPARWRLIIVEQARADGRMDSARGHRTVDVPDTFNLCLLLLGVFIEPLPAMLLAPLFLPLAKHFNMDMVRIGVVMTANLAILCCTRPVGGTRCSSPPSWRTPVSVRSRYLCGR